VEHAMMMMLAGPVAQQRYTGGSWDDYGASDDVRQCNRLALALHDNGETLKAFITYLELWTRDLVDGKWPAIERVAKGLMERRTLNGDEIRSLALPPELAT
jgi:hypothetical protein